jgi:hypothetical protein
MQTTEGMKKKEAIEFASSRPFFPSLTSLPANFW